MWIIFLLLFAVPAFAVDVLDPIGPNGIATGGYGEPSATIHFYVDGEPSNPDSWAGFAPLVNGRFSFPIPDKYKDNKPHQLRAYFVTQSSGLLPGSPQPFTLAAGPTYPPVTYTIEWKPGLVDKTHPTPTGFKVLANGVQIGQTAASVLSFAETVSLAPGVDRCWTVRAFVPGGEAADSNKACISMFDVAPTYPSVPPLTSLSQQVAPIVWTLGAPSKQYPGNYDILRNGQTVQGARGSQIAMCGNVIYVLGRDKLWWRFNVNSWVATGQATLTCATP